MSSTHVPGDDLRKIVSRIHVVLLFCVALTSSVVSSVGKFSGKGPYALLAGQPWGYVGLIQAYLFIMIIFGVIWVGTKNGGSRHWNWLGILAHVPPLIANLINQDVFTATNTRAMSTGGFVIHGTLISLELFGILWKAPMFGQVHGRESGDSKSLWGG